MKTINETILNTIKTYCIDIFLDSNHSNIKCITMKDEYEIRYHYRFPNQYIVKRNAIDMLKRHIVNGDFLRCEDGLKIKASEIVAYKIRSVSTDQISFKKVTKEGWFSKKVSYEII